MEGGSSAGVVSKSMRESWYGLTMKISSIFGRSGFGFAFERRKGDGQQNES